MVDLLKNLMQWTKKLQTRTPNGWRRFLSTMTELNIPTLAFHNPRARDMRLKAEGEFEPE